MKKLIIMSLVAVMLTGCDSTDTDMPLGSGTEYSIGRLSFSSSLSVDEYENSFTVIDDKFDGIIEIHCLDISEIPAGETIPTLWEQYERKLTSGADIAELKPEYSFTNNVSEDKITIDGITADSLTAQSCLYRPERGYAWYFIEAAMFELDGKLYGISYCYDTTRDDLSYTYDPERDSDDITVIKQRASTIYDFIDIK